MDGHFRAFSFVDRITVLEPGRLIRGHYAVPSNLPRFAPSLAAEAVGQLAAWAAMDVVGFASRPLAGIAGRIELLREVPPGAQLDLEADLHSVDADAIGYSGLAAVHGVPVLRLHDCVGPMLPVESFDDPAALRARFEQIRTQGAAPGAFGGIPEFHPEPVDVEPGQRVQAVLTVPVEVPLFSDHFPRRPVLPGTLLMHAGARTAVQLVEGIPPNGHPWVLRAYADVKLRSFIPPGSTVRFEARRESESAEELEVGIAAHIGNRLVGGCTMAFAKEARA